MIRQLVIRQLFPPASRFIALSALLALAPPLFAQNLPAPANTDNAQAGAPSEASPAAAARGLRAASLLTEAFDLANANADARPNAVRASAGLLPRLGATNRARLTSRWLRLAMSPDVSRAVRLSAFDTFFDVAARADEPFARAHAMGLPDAAGRAGAFLQLSRAVYPRDFRRANADSQLAMQAARREPSPLIKARALTYSAFYISVLNPATRRAAVQEAVKAALALPPTRGRDALMAELVGAAAKFDLEYARRLTNNVSDSGLRGLANARVSLSEVSQTTLTGSSQDRIAALARVAAPYDSRAIPILVQLPPQAETLKALSDALPPISATANPAIQTSTLEQVWNYTSALQPSVYRDQLQSRLARLMTTQDPWRGRAWGKRLAWKGGRIQVGAFLKQVLQARTATALASRPNALTLQARLANLPDLSDRSIDDALSQARTLPPAARVEALLLVAGQLLA